MVSSVRDDFHLAVQAQINAFFGFPFFLLCPWDLSHLKVFFSDKEGAPFHILCTRHDESLLDHCPYSL